MRIQVEARNVPVDNTWDVFFRAAPRNGQQVYLPMAYVSSNLAQSFWEVDATFPKGFSAMTVRAARK